MLQLKNLIYFRSRNCNEIELIQVWKYTWITTNEIWLRPLQLQRKILFMVLAILPLVFYVPYLRLNSYEELP